MTSNTTAPKPAPQHSRIQIRNKQRRYRINRPSVAVFCSNVLREIESPDSALSVAFISSGEMRAINTQYLNKPYPTDVLSFSYKEAIMNGGTLLGEILVAPEVAAKNAGMYRVQPDREIKKLLIHGILHLSGYDHEIDDGAMQRLQARLMRRSFVRNAPAILEPAKARS